MNIELNLRLAAALFMDELRCSRWLAHSWNAVKATLIKHGAAWCSEECAERAGDFATDSGQLFLHDEHDEGILPDLSGSGNGMVKLLDALTDRGLCPTLLFDDDGRWALSFTSFDMPGGFTAVADGTGDEDDDAIIWDESMTMAVALAADRYLEGEA